MREPLVFDIKRASTSDGPGLRTAVFFKGCNLDCFWCHNPEGKSAAPQTAFFSEKCISCGACRFVCKQTDETCVSCGACAEVCSVGARKLYGRAYTVDGLTEILLKDRAYYDATGGGVTFSGGECMLYPEYLAEVAMRCKQNGVSVAIDTAGHVPYEHFEALLPYTDLFLYDVKCLDSDLHRRGTGVDNSLILENLDRLQKADKQILVRMPVIPDFNDGEERERVAAFCASRGLAVEFLAYHAFGEDKKRALKR